VRWQRITGQQPGCSPTGPGGQFDDKPSTKRAASSLAKAVSGAEIVDATKPAAAAAKSSARRPAM
jgi:hypothetical protein